MTEKEYLQATEEILAVTTSPGSATFELLRKVAPDKWKNKAGRIFIRTEITQWACKQP